MENFVPEDVCPNPEPFRVSLGLIVFLTWLFYMTFVTRVVFAPVLPFIEADLGLDHAQAGALFFMMSIGFAIAPLFVGMISARINHRGTLIVANLGVGIALVLFSFFRSYAALRIIMIILGAAAGLHIPSAVAAITAQVQRQDWGKALAVHQIAPPLSFVSAPMIVVAFSNWLAWQTLLMILGCLSLATAILFAVRGRGGGFPGQALNFSVARDVLGHRSFWIMVVLFAMAMSGTMGVYSMLPLYLIEEQGFSPGPANTIIGLSQCTGLVMVFFSGMITDRIGVKQTITLALAGAGLLTLAVGFFSGYTLIPFIFLQPLFITSFFPGAFAAMSRIVRPRFRSVSNALGPSMAFLIGGGVMPAVIGSVAKIYSISVGIMIAGCFILIGPLVVGFLTMGQYDDESGC
jgi:MFS transporter, NNP family, nitrate/nitrite transporter